MDMFMWTQFFYQFKIKEEKGKSKEHKFLIFPAIKNYFLFQYYQDTSKSLAKQYHFPLYNMSINFNIHGKT